MSHFIYLLRTRESIRLGEDVYKLGKTRHGVKRLKGYPKGSELILMAQTPDCDAMERELLSAFSELYVQRVDMGVEYFEGNPLSMLGLIYERLQSAHWPVPEPAAKPAAEPTVVAETAVYEFSFEGYTGSAKPTPMAAFLKPQKLRHELALLGLEGAVRASAKAAIATAHQEAINRHIQACFYEPVRVKYGSTKKVARRASPPACGLVLRLGSIKIGHSDAYDAMKKAELVALAKKRKIKSASKLTVAQLRTCLRGY